MAVVALLVLLGGLLVDDLELHQREHRLGAPRLLILLGEEGIDAEGQIDDEVEHLVGAAREGVSALAAPLAGLLRLVAQRQVQLVDVRPQLGGPLHQLPERDEVVLGLRGHHVVEGHQGSHQVVQHRHHVLHLAGDHPVAHLVEDLRRHRLPLGDELGDDRVLGLHVPDELDDGEPEPLHLPGALHHPLVDHGGDVALGHLGAEEQLASLEVVDDVHHLEHDAGDLPVALWVPGVQPRGEEEEIVDLAGPGDGRRHPVAEGRAEVLHRVGEDAVEQRPVERIGVAELVQPEEVVDLVAVAEVQPPPVDHRAAAQEEPQRLQIVEVELAGLRQAQLARRALGGARAVLLLRQEAVPSSKVASKAGLTYLMAWAE